jgi:hypothetical protein
MRRRWPIIVVTVLLVVLAGHFLLWRWACARIAGDTEAWASQQRALGNTVTLGAPQDEGWPLAARVRFAGATLGTALAGLPGGAIYQADSAAVGIDLRDIWHLAIGFDGPQHVRLGPSAPVDFTTAHCTLLLPLGVDPPVRQADLSVDDLLVSSPAGNGLRVAQLLLHVVLPATANQPLAFDLKAGPIALPAGAVPDALGTSVSNLGLVAAVTAPTQSNATSWRDAGGTITVPEMALDWGKLSLSGHATMRLDARLQPAGTGDLRLVGTGPALDALVGAHLIDPRGATAAMAVLALLQRPQVDGPPAVELPLTLQDQTLQLGHFRLLKLPEMIW